MGNRILETWRESREFGIVVLESDWAGEHLDIPMLDPEAKLSDLSPLSPRDRARLCGYAREGEKALFVVETERFPFLLRSGVTAYLAASFNGWEKVTGGEEWRLLPTLEGLLILEKPWGEMVHLAPFSFKFITERDEWLDPSDAAPNIDKTMPGARNLIFRTDRSCRDVLRFPLLPEEQAEPIEELAARHLPEGWFGVRIETDVTRFRLFAPRANRVTLNLTECMDGFPAETFSLEKDVGGAWETAIPGDKSGWFYLYQVDGNEQEVCTDFDDSRTVLDPYALAALGPAGPGVVLNPSSPVTEPFAPPEREDLVIVEAHVRDLLAHAPLNLSPGERLSFSGLAKWLRSDDCYLCNLGANAIELQPILEPDAVTSEDYFWGYMPVNFFAPASHYSSRPDQASGIAEFRDLVTAFHEAGMAVILDVVYNHVGVPNHLARIDKGLYFATDKFGRLTNHSGCGNDLRAKSPAARRLVVDSLKYLVQTFDLDGFRIDLAELLGLDLLREIEQELLSLKPSLHLIAEPWSFRGRLSADIRDTSYSLWSDDLREGLLKYSLGKGKADSVLRWLRGSLDDSLARPAQTVNYVESHDDYAFIDRLTENPRRNGSNPTVLDLRRHRLALAVLLASPGVPMLSAGQDFLRSKKGVRNTYLRGDLNALDYSLIEKYPEHHAYVRDWIALRLSEIGNLLRPAAYPPDAYYQTFTAEDGQAVAILINTDYSEGPDRLLFAVNPSAKKDALLPVTPEQLGEPVLVAESEKVSMQGLRDIFARRDGFLRLPPVSSAMWTIQ